MEYSKETVGKRLSIIRQDKGYTQKSLSAESGVSEDSITRYERGNGGMTLETAFYLTETLGSTLDQLVGREEYAIV